MNDCINAAWHGVDQSVALLRCNEAQGALIAAFRSSALLGLVSLIAHGIDSTRCWKNSSEILVHIDMIASRS